MDGVFDKEYSEWLSAQEPKTPEELNAYLDKMASYFGE